MFRTRLISGVVLVLLSVFFILMGGWWLLVPVTAISVIGMYELYRVFQMEKSPLALSGYAAVVVYFLNLAWNFLPDPMILLLTFLIILMFVYVFAYPKYHAKQLLAAFFALFYVGVMLSYVYQIRELEHGVYLTFLIFLCSWGCDTCAYCVGKPLGKHKMTPELSPKKSVEGAIGGVLGAALLTAIYCFVFRKAMELEMIEIVILSGIAAIAGMISMVGDLTASAIKRNYEIKDYGTLIPGHGGVLDRFDSMIITAPILYYLASMLL